MFISPEGKVTVLCGISEPYKVISVVLERSLVSNLIVSMSESKPLYFDKVTIDQAQIDNLPL